MHILELIRWQDIVHFSSPLTHSVARFRAAWRSRLSSLLSLSYSCPTSKLVRIILIVSTKTLLIFNVVMASASTNTLTVIQSCRYWVLPSLLWVSFLFASLVATAVIRSVQALDNTEHAPWVLISSKANRCISSSPRILLQQTWLNLPLVCSIRSLFGSSMDTRYISLIMTTLTR